MMRASVLVLSFVVSTAPLLAQSANASRPKVNTRNGFRSSIALLRGSSALTSTDLDVGSDRTSGWADNYSVGYYLNRSVSIDADVSTLYGNADGGKQRDYNILVGITGYPSVSNGFHVFGAVGRSRTVATVDGETLEVTGAAYSLGAGFDIPIDVEFSVTPFFRYMGSTGGSLYLNGSKVGDVNVNQAQFGLALRWH